MIFPSMRLAAFATCVLLVSCGGGGGSSNANSVAAPSSPSATTPGAPTSLTATAADAAVTLSFSAPASDGGASISGYTATCTAGTASRTTTGTASPLTVTGLSNGTQYSCSVVATNRIGSGSPSSAVAATPISASSSAEFPGNIVLGAPTADSIRLKLYSADQSGSVIVSYRAEGDAGDKQTTPITLNRAAVLDAELSGLKAGTSYRYRVLLKPTTGNEIQSREYRFQTARAPGSSFTFTIQADSHLDENSDLDIYKRTLTNVLTDQGDFHVDLGDTFMTEKHAEPFTAVVAQPTSKATLDTRYIYERANFGAVTHSVPLFLVNGNHDAELGWLVDGSTQNIAIWASKARLEYFPIPQPGKIFLCDRRC